MRKLWHALDDKENMPAILRASFTWTMVSAGLTDEAAELTTTASLYELLNGVHRLKSWESLEKARAFYLLMLGKHPEVATGLEGKATVAAFSTLVGRSGNADVTALDDAAALIGIHVALGAGRLPEGCWDICLVAALKEQGVPGALAMARTLASLHPDMRTRARLSFFEELRRHPIKERDRPTRSPTGRTLEARAADPRVDLLNVTEQLLHSGLPLADKMIVQVLEVPHVTMRRSLEVLYPFIIMSSSTSSFEPKMLVSVVQRAFNAGLDPVAKNVLERGYALARSAGSLDLFCASLADSVERGISDSSILDYFVFILESARAIEPLYLEKTLAAITARNMVPIEDLSQTIGGPVARKCRTLAVLVIEIYRMGLTCPASFIGDVIARCMNYKLYEQVVYLHRLVSRRGPTLDQNTMVYVATALIEITLYDDAATILFDSGTPFDIETDTRYAVACLRCSAARGFWRDVDDIFKAFLDLRTINEEMCRAMMEICRVWKRGSLALSSLAMIENVADISSFG
jgi:hypothetical protein